MLFKMLKAIPSLRIFNEAKAREFYVDFLEFLLEFEHRFELDFPVFMQISLNGVVLRLTEHHGDCSPGALVSIPMVGLAAYHSKLISKQYAYARPGLVDQPWGDTTMTISDPFVNRISFSEATSGLGQRVGF